VKPSAVAVVPGGVEPRFMRASDPAVLHRAREKLGVGEAPFILSIGVIEPRKNLNRLMDAFRILKERKNVPDNLKLVLAGGKGWLYDEIFQHHADSPVRDDILLPGFVSDELLPAIYSTADALAFPSLYEGFGLPILEAMACGTPVVASRASCLPEVAEGAALLVDPNNIDGLACALERALLDGDLRQGLIAQGLQRAREYTWQRAAEQLLSVYHQVAAG
jgi:glycosyltransferase involved in cell wall biosynthesis